LNRHKHIALESIGMEIHEEACKEVGYLCKLIAESLSWKCTNKPRVYLQNYVVHETLGSSRLVLVQTLYYIVVNDASRKYRVINDIPEQCWQVLIYWFTELK
jgi:hypothetical protein